MDSLGKIRREHPPLTPRPNKICNCRKDPEEIDSLFAMDTAQILSDVASLFAIELDIH